MRVLLPASVLLIVGLLLGWIASDHIIGGDDREEISRAVVEMMAPTRMPQPSTPTLQGSPGAVDPSGVAPASALEELRAFAREDNAASDLILGLIEGTPGFADATLLALIAADDDLYRRWLAVFLAYDGPSVAEADLDMLAQLSRMYRAYREQGGADPALLDVLDANEQLLRTQGAVHLPLDLPEALLPTWIDYLEAHPADSNPGAAESRLFRELATLASGYPDRPGGRLPALRHLQAAARDRMRDLQRRGEAVVVAGYEEPWSRWRGDLGRLLLMDSKPAASDLLVLITTSSSALAIVATVPDRDLARVVLRDVGLARLTTDGVMSRERVNQAAREHVDRFLTFLALLEVETPYGRLGLFPYGPGDAGARLYLLVSALHARNALPRSDGIETTWFTGMADDRVEEELQRRYPELATARELAWEMLAVELQGAVREGLR